MNILTTQYTLSRKSLEIYVAGCKGNNGVHCTSCHNPESWEFNQGNIYNELYFNKIKTKINDFNDMINKIELFGGELNDQNNEELEVFLRDLKLLGKEIWLFTRYDLKDCPKFELELCDYIKCGAYNPKLSCNNNLQYGINLSTSNQHIYKKGIDY